MGQGVLTGDSPLSEAAMEQLFADAGLSRRDGRLLLEGVPLDTIADAVGTPAYVYNAEAIRRRYHALDGALRALPHRICYAAKANSNLAVLRLLRDLGAGADIVSGGELARVLAAGFPPARIVFSGVGKTDQELLAAIRSGIGHINVESLAELERIGELATEESRPVALGIRVNPDVTTATHPYISTGKSGIKFGVPLDQVEEAARIIRDHPLLRLTALAMHLGSQLSDPEPFVQGIGRLTELLEDVRQIGAPDLSVIDVGGGLGIRYGDEPAMDPERYAAAVVPLLAPLGLTTYLEPGRFLVGSAGVLLTTVLYRKSSGGKAIAVVDAGMNDLVRPSHYQAYHAFAELNAAGRPPERVDVVGPVCETGDFLALDRELPGLARGDRLAVLGAGAYGFVMSSNYNTRPRAAEVMVEGGRFWTARPRERVEDLFQSELPCPNPPPTES
ncbi:MAG TPA: diaminopimelate decarboxylase [Gemmatimonadales bacterium]|nr:diaminopimelate decarboxylase [Gemmatimonadales bacterium]